MHLNLLSILLIATTTTAIAIPNDAAYADLCVDTARRNELDKQAIAACRPNDITCYCNTQALRDFMEEVKTMTCPGKKIDPLKVKAYRMHFNWKCAGAIDFVPLVV
ncbi:uncharacterized protein E2P81_ATG05542 [Venturia nashicola]|nr:uncharacterized protein E2P81_ATG05542 [Venturia nashicola]